DTAPTQDSTLSLHDALPIFRKCWSVDYNDIHASQWNYDTDYSFANGDVHNTKIIYDVDVYLLFRDDCLLIKHKLYCINGWSSDTSFWSMNNNAVNDDCYDADFSLRQTRVCHGDGGISNWVCSRNWSNLIRLDY